MTDPADRPSPPISAPRTIPLRQGYGSGVFRRRIRLESEPDRVRAALEDDNHGFRLTLVHDRSRIVAVEAEALRFPATTCREAVAILRHLEGQPLTDNRGVFRGYDDPRRHCIHLHNLLGLAMMHALSGRDLRVYDVEVPDLREGCSDAEIRCDNELVHRLRVDGSCVLAPSPLAGNPLEAGFGRWARAEFERAAFGYRAAGVTT